MSKRFHSKKNNRKTRRNNGGNIVNNIGNLKKDKKIKGNYYETEIEVNKIIYNIHYFTASNFIFFKTTEQYRTPTFNIYLNENPMQYKLMIDEFFINTIVILKYKTENRWYAISRAVDQVRKGNLTNTGFYRIYNVFSNDNEKLYIKDPNKYTMAKDTITILKKNTFQLTTKQPTTKILTQFIIQQTSGEVGKEVATGIGIQGIADLLF